MDKFKKVLLSLAIASGMMISASAFAEGASDAKVKAAGEGALAKVSEAVDLQAKGADKSEVLASLSEARQLQKEFRFEGTERLRQKAGDKMKVAKNQVESGDAAAIESLKETQAMYVEMMKVYNAAH